MKPVNIFNICHIYYWNISFINVIIIFRQFKYMYVCIPYFSKMITSVCFNCKFGKYIKYNVFIFVMTQFV